MYKFITILLAIHTANSALLLWTPKPTYLPALKPFTNDDYLKLLKELDNPQVIAFQPASLEQAAKLHKALNNTNTVYLLKPEIDIFENVEAQEITDDTVIPPDIAKGNVLVVLQIQDSFPRTKRQVDNSTIMKEEIIEEPFVVQSEPPITGAVLYTYLMDNKDEVMVYSSQPLLLYIDDMSINLGSATMTFIDIRESMIRLIARISTVNNRTIFVRFIFSLFGGYWYLNFIEVEVNSIRYNLALIGNNVTAPNHMSYHCEGQTVFTDTKTNISLYMNDLQAQPDARNHRFSAAYNCIPFTTAPILSGLFVTAIMCIGLAIGLMALASIKTMDRFDTSKTKQLSITLFE